MDGVKQTIETYNKIAKQYHESHQDSAPIKELLDFFIKNVPGKVILDAGCGNGRDAKYFSENGFDVTGIDASAEMLAIAVKFAPRAQFLPMDIRDLEFADESFDGIWSVSTFLYVPKGEALQTLLEWKRVLRKGGIMLVNIRKGEGEKETVEELNPALKKWCSFYSIEEFEDLVNKCELRKVELIEDGDWLNIFAVKD
ncbi:MAG: class I SAM-dependent methyltransferase [Candidatus Woesearchaeota archaeon]